MTPPSRRARLRAIKHTRALSARRIGELTHRAPGTVRQYLCGALEVPGDFLELLEFKLGMRAVGRAPMLDELADAKPPRRRSGGDAGSATPDAVQDSCACGDEKTTTTRGR